jgi:DNA (cytosine-5)-methyltransferase 1
MSNERPTFGSLFAGIGGIDLGLERAGWECRFQVEWDPFCQRVLAKHWPDVPRYGDITTVDWSGVERVDLLAGGFPCQPVSNAGKKLAQDDDRWLWPEFRRAIDDLRPRFVLVENVTGLLARGLGIVLGDLASIGYDAEWDCIPAAAVGAPHLRDRVWIIAYPAGERCHDGASPEVSPVYVAGQPTGHQQQRGGRLDWISSLGAPVSHADSQRGRGWLGQRQDATNAREPSRREELGHWDVEPDVGRVAHGVPARVDRLRSLGNAVVPQVVEYIGRQLLEAEAVTA